MRFLLLPALLLDIWVEDFIAKKRIPTMITMDGSD